MQDVEAIESPPVWERVFLHPVGRVVSLVSLFLMTLAAFRLLQQVAGLHTALTFVIVAGLLTFRGSIFVAGAGIAGAVLAWGWPWYVAALVGLPGIVFGWFLLVGKLKAESMFTRAIKDTLQGN